MVTVNPFKTQRLIQALLMLGPSTYHQLADVTGLTPGQVGDALRNAMKQDQYGLYILKTEESGQRGAPKNVMAIDIEKYNRYVKSAHPRAKNAPRISAEHAARMPKRPVIEKPKKHLHVQLPQTAYKTMWQDSSPYRDLI